jgi:hypothetical protein
MLWDLLTIMGFVVCIAAAHGSARDARSGFWGYVLAITLGLAVGVFFVWSMRAVPVVLFSWLDRQAQSRQWWINRAIVLAVAFWILATAILAAGLSSMTLRLFFRP